MTDAYVPLPSGARAVIDAADYETVMEAGPWFEKRDRHTSYARRHTRRADGRRVTQYLHQFLAGAQGVDHADGDGLNNRRSNLRPASRSQNGGNGRKCVGKSSRFKGVTWRAVDQRWQARITVNWRLRSLGTFTDEEAAARAYDAAAIQAFGEFARLNFPERKTA